MSGNVPIEAQGSVFGLEKASLGRRGIVLYDVSAVDQPMFVLCDGYEYGPIAWGPPRASLLPAAGDAVVILQVDDNTVVCVLWWPYGE